jgi:hypothetical protein
MTKAKRLEALLKVVFSYTLKHKTMSSNHSTSKNNNDNFVHEISLHGMELSTCGIMSEREAFQISAFQIKDALSIVIIGLASCGCCEELRWCA